MRKRKHTEDQRKRKPKERKTKGRKDQRKKGKPKERKAEGREGRRNPDPKGRQKKGKLFLMSFPSFILSCCRKD